MNDQDQDPQGCFVCFAGLDRAGQGNPDLGAEGDGGVWGDGQDLRWSDGDDAVSLDGGGLAV